MLFLIFSISLMTKNGFSSYPQWQDLECQAGHKYLFNTEQKHTWEVAIAECRLHGGWLLDITDIAEYNCLIRYGNSQRLDAWFWTDANDQASNGVWVHASTNTELTWINPKWGCAWMNGNRADSGFLGGNVMIMNFSNDKRINGAWCDDSTTNAWNYICKAPISNRHCLTYI